MLKFFFSRLFSSSTASRKNDYPLRQAVARWCIQQFVTCPYCKKEFDIIATNLKRKANQGTITLSQDQVASFDNYQCSGDKDLLEMKKTLSTIPRPPYFGAMMENTENLEECIDCVRCNKTIVVKEAHWGYGK